MSVDNIETMMEIHEVQSQKIAVETDRHVFDRDLQRTLKLVKEFKINFLNGFANDPMQQTSSSSCSTTSLVSGEYKLSPIEEARNMETLLKIQAIVQQMTIFSNDDTEDKIADAQQLL